MNIFVTGGTGFVGRSLVKHLVDNGHQLTVLSRNTATRAGNPRLLQGDPVKPGTWLEELRNNQTVINLAGSSIFCRWNQTNRQRILDSRILSTRNIVSAISTPGSKIKILLNCSAVGYYGDRGDEELTEDSPNGQGFLAEICKAWETEASLAEVAGVRVVLCRLGVVLGRNGGALEQMARVFRIGLGARLGRGQQWFPWIHQTDLARIFTQLMENPGVSGPVNCVAPQCVTNLELTRTLAKVLHRPLLFPPVPAFVLKTLQGEASALLLASQKVSPALLSQINFSYDFPSLTLALTDLLKIKE
jgi:uncharacterized protein (TIGR01777 family)